MVTLERRLIQRGIARFALLELDHQANWTLPRNCDEIGVESEELPWWDAGLRRSARQPSADPPQCSLIDGLIGLVVGCGWLRGTVVNEIVGANRGVEQSPAHHPIVGVFYLFIGVGQRVGVAQAR